MISESSPAVSKPELHGSRVSLGSRMRASTLSRAQCVDRRVRGSICDSRLRCREDDTDRAARSAITNFKVTTDSDSVRR